MTRFLAALALVSTLAFAAAAAAEEPAKGAVDDFEWIVLPNSETSTDRGIGSGVLGLFYWYDGARRPYRNKLELGGVVTTKLHQNYYAIWERLGLFSAPLRLRLKLGFLATLDDNFCGIGNEVTCDEGDAEAAALAAGLAPGSSEFDDFTRHYFKIAAKRPYFEATLRWRAFDDNPRVELSTKWTSHLEIAGTFSDGEPYPGSLFDQRFDGGQEELLSVIESGVLLDRRDHEIHPTKGLIAGGYGRAAVGISGDPRAYVGATAVGGGYLPFGDFVVASRAALDVIGGDAPIREIGEIGGFWSTTAFGGGFGRGIRASRFIGKVKLVSQLELRYRRPLRGRVHALGTAFVDAGWVAASVTRVGGDADRVLVSGGGGPGLSWGTSFVARLDVGFSRYESWSPFFYLRIGHPF